MARKPKPWTPLLRLRLERQLHRYEVAAAIGINDRTLGNWETGAVSLTIENATKLANYYGVDINAVAGWTPPQPQAAS